MPKIEIYLESGRNPTMPRVTPAPLGGGVES